MEDIDYLKGLNEMPVNERARRVLEQSGEKPVDGCFHCAQAAMCAIDRGLVIVEADVAETVRAMMTWRPQRIVNFFMIMSGEDYEPPGWEGASRLKEFAAVILDDIEAKIVIHFPYYRSPES